MTYEQQKRWRLRYPDKRSAMRRRNYQRGMRDARRGYQPWTQEEDIKVLAHSVTDRELARDIGRSVQAIQIRRSRLGGKSL